MRRLIFLFLFLFYLTNISAVNYYEVSLISNESGIFVNNIDVKLSGNEIDFYSKGETNYVVISNEGEALYEGEFSKFEEVFFDGDLGGGFFGSTSIIYNLTEINLVIPYYENAKKIIIYDDNFNELDSVDVSMYSKDYQKTSVIDALGEDVSEDENLENEEEISQNKTNYIEKAKKYWWVLIIVLVLLALKLIYDLNSKKKI
ncbi:MAG: hypothetical protein OQK82_01800 [Candidatus Pacearchaeota archaeon]|nr:hypothetical protein [Candidatus Pacearchaeota archaeon]